MWSMTNTSTGPVFLTSLRPAWILRASGEGDAPGSGGSASEIREQAEAGPGRARKLEVDIELSGEASLVDDGDMVEAAYGDAGGLEAACNLVHGEVIHSHVRQLRVVCKDDEATPGAKGRVLDGGCGQVRHGRAERVVRMRVELRSRACRVCPSGARTWGSCRVSV